MSARDSSWVVVANAGKDDQGDEWFAFGSVCGIVGMAEKGDSKYAGLMFRCGGENGNIFCCMKEGDVGEAGAFSVPLWGLGTPQGAMGGKTLAPGLVLGGTCWSVEDGGDGIAVLRHAQSPGLGVYFLPKEGKIVYMCQEGCDIALVISPRWSCVCVFVCICLWGVCVYVCVCASVERPSYSIKHCITCALDTHTLTQTHKFWAQAQTTFRVCACA